MGLKKKHNLKLKIPSSPTDYAPMPEQTKRLILEANRMKNDLKYVDEDIVEVSSPGTSAITPRTSTGENAHPLTRMPSWRMGNDEYERTDTPEVKITVPEEEITETVPDNEDKSVSTVKIKTPDQESPVMLRRQLKRNSISAPAGLSENEIEALKKLYLEHVNRVSLV